ncbi:MAG: hypothetical protein HYS27_02825 [Deltaproteobacteria bacterium]|nr:hypothetical protein [Deltaproteobacteria bacterium]
MSAAVHAEEPTPATTATASENPVAAVGEPAASPDDEEVLGAETPDLRVAAPLAGGIGAAVGVVAGGVAGVGAAYGASLLVADGSAGGSGAAGSAFAEIASPILVLGLPVLGAGLGAFGALALVTDMPNAAIGGVVAAVATPLGAVAGAVVGVVVGVVMAKTQYSNADPLFAMAIVGGSGVLGAGVGAIVGASTGGAAAGFAAASVK